MFLVGVETESNDNGESMDSVSGDTTVLYYT
jgi:hypothetical protein